MVPIKQNTYDGVCNPSLVLYPDFPFYAEPEGLMHREIDRVLAAHYGFTDEELDFPSIKLRTGIPSTKLRAGNYDIKYRMGRDAEADDK